MLLRRRDILRHALTTAGTVAVSTALSSCTLRPGRPGRPGLSRVEFVHGVASGDPQSDAVILWTRAQPTDDAAEVRVGWELAADPDFRYPLRSGELRSDAGRDFTVKIDVRDLQPGTRYFYRFLGAATASTVGTTRTLPVGATESVRLAVFSCANYPAGYFHPYAEASLRGDYDAFLHLGDYFYEYGAGGYATERAAELGRDFAPDNAGELYSLDDYRRRYALYRGDRDLQALHAVAPMIAVWDDHEIANDAWMGGAQNHGPDEGDYGTRRAAAVRAYFEWMPLRPLQPDAEGRIYRSFDFGDLVSLHMLDTRLTGRDQQLEYDHFRDARSGRYDMEGLKRALGDPERNMLGAPQRRWLDEQLVSSPAKWQVLGQQTLITRMHFPVELLQAMFARRDYTAGAPLIGELAELAARRQRGADLGAEELRRLRAVLPYNLDAWDGYPAERERLYAMVERTGKPLVVLSGDTHNAWYSALQDASGREVGVEIATPGVSSPGMESYLGLDDDAAQALQRAMPLLVDELRYCELQHRGYLEVEFSRSAVRSSWHFVDDVTARRYERSAHSEVFEA